MQPTYFLLRCSLAATIAVACQDPLPQSTAPQSDGHGNDAGPQPATAGDDDADDDTDDDVGDTADDDTALSDDDSSDDDDTDDDVDDDDDTDDPIDVPMGDDDDDDVVFGAGGTPVVVGQGGGGATGNPEAGAAGMPPAPGGAPNDATGGAGGDQSTNNGGSGGSPDVCDTIFIEPYSHHLGDGDGNEGISWSKTFDVSCDCLDPWLSFQIDGPTYFDAPTITWNGAQLQPLQDFFPELGDGPWQYDSGGNPTDYNGYLQIHYSVLGLVNNGSNSFMIQNGIAADDYNFGDVRLECQGLTNPPGPDLVNRGGWVGYYDDRADDDPLGIQGSFYAYGDGYSCTPPDAPCQGPGCCLSGQTVTLDPSIAWGCALGFDLRSAGGDVKEPYPGPVECFLLELTGDSGGNAVRATADTHQDMTDRFAPILELGPIDGTTTHTVCFSDLECPDWADVCDLTGEWYALKLEVVGGERDAAFDVCLRSLIPLP